ncbi:Retrotransposable element Tf2 type 1, partial [Paramuricea clavata]
PSTPWEKVGTDLFQLKNKDYLIVVDYTSKYFEVSALPNTLASTVVQQTKSIFARFGIPKTVVSDNGPQYSSHQYKTFAREWGFQHDTSSPRYPKRQSVQVSDGKSWHVKGKVMERVEQPRSYAVETEKGTIIRRNRRDLLSTPERFDLRDAVDDEMEIPPNPLAVQLPQPNQPTLLPIIHLYSRQDLYF